jgi:VWFA-related protein
MFLAVPTTRSPLFFFRKLFCLLIGLCLGLAANIAVTNSAGLQAEAGLRLELPANGNLRVENLRGGVIVELWSEDYLSVAALTDSGQESRSPAIMQRTDSLLSMRVPRGPAGAARINLRLKIPARTHVAIVTTESSVQVRGLPAALLVQTVSGEIRVELPGGAGADVLADSKTGTVSSSLSSAVVDRAHRPQLQARLGPGGKSVRLYSQAGNIALAASTESAPIISSTAPAERREPLEPAAIPRPTQRPELIGPEKNTPAAGTPATPSSGPEEISEGDIIRVDTQLVSVNVSVVDRGTNRGVNDLIKEDFRLAEDNVAQQIAHFDSASAPFNLVLLVDLSGSTTKVVELIKAAAIHFVEAARPFDRIGVITFAGGQVVVSPLTTDHEALRQRIASIERPQGSTKLYDSLAFAMDEVFREAKDSRRNAIVLMSDGLDSVLPNVTGEGSKLSYQEVVRRAKEFDGVVYSIWVDTQSYEPLSPLDIQQETFDLAHDRLRELADVGGGAFYDLGMLYTLSYRPSNKIRDGSWRTIRVNVNKPNAVARGKRGYYAK